MHGNGAEPIAVTEQCSINMICYSYHIYYAVLVDV